MEEVCKKVVEKIPSSLQYVPDHLKTQGMSDDAVRRRLWLLKYVSDWVFTKQQLKIWYDYDDYYYDDKLVKCYDGY